MPLLTGARAQEDVEAVLAAIQPPNPPEVPPDVPPDVPPEVPAENVARNDVAEAAPVVPAGAGQNDDLEVYIAPFDSLGHLVRFPFRFISFVIQDA